MPSRFEPGKLREALAIVRSALPETSQAISHDLTRPQLARLLGDIGTVSAELARLAEQLDPIQQPRNLIDLTDPQTMGMLIGKALEETPENPLMEAGEFYGSGVYALYYQGQFDSYHPIRGTKCPIYVGKADPEDSRADTPRKQGPRLCVRLAEHAKTIGHAKNLDVSDFTCRYLVVQSGWQKAAEDYLIHQYQPVWNKEMKVCPGFGKHGDAARRERSAWDILHAGRRWADRQASRSGLTEEKVKGQIEEHFAKLHRDDRARWGKILRK